MGRIGYLYQKLDYSGSFRNFLLFSLFIKRGSSSQREGGSRGGFQEGSNWMGVSGSAWERTFSFLQVTNTK